MPVNEQNRKAFRVIVTGDRDDWNMVAPADGGPEVEWQSVPVLQYERLPVPADLMDRLSLKPVEWIIFTSPRSVRFWSETLLESGYELPVETRVACLGDRTAQVASEDGFTVDFSPKEPGTDGFLEEFEAGTRAVHQSVLIPAAEGGRPKLKERLSQLGFEVTWLPLYRTMPREDIAESLSAEDLQKADAIVFTSPSSVDAIMEQVQVPPDIRVLAIGGFTGHHLEKKGFVRPRLLPNGDFSRIGEVLC